MTGHSMGFWVLFAAFATVAMAYNLPPSRYPQEDEESICAKYPCCYLANSTDGCSLADMPKLPSTIVFPGGVTRCIFTESTAYGFQVWPGDADKLIFYFQGGGACWDKESTESHLCTTSIEPRGTEGIFDRSNSDNVFSAYTIVQVLYCSGDLHAGNVTRPYNDFRGNPVVQRGQANVAATLDWIREQQNQGNLNTVFEDLVVMGDSAGSIGAQVWSGALLDKFQYKKAAIVPDSYIGVFPPNSQGPLIYNYGACDFGRLNLPPYLYQDCLNQTLTLQDVTAYWLSQNPNIPFAFLQSKADATQISFYIALAISIGDDPILTDGEFYSRANDIMALYNQYPNFVVYLVDGTQHTFTPNKLYYSANPDGPRETGTDSDSMDNWLPALPLSPGDSISTICDGKVEDLGDPTYCSSAVYPKTFTQS
eukprot:CAMPEP_0201478722 /NCGR_PEP_ID=MMETSP0151_2-20130828/3497_1 /ASSEMBLY_ACC=CAM_ASM_000257 /TAXON_ID=200890 /ORGANISM="Paramoeba atlantica, Strain 621/1 / CCAP 1560/9" /LENGTH=422 /DNA_ID=CAMNT_0047859893 /DNA_START=34 /DNA_END=1302 /DNA_ORIENTATION=-